MKAQHSTSLCTLHTALDPFNSVFFCKYLFFQLKMTKKFYIEVYG